MVTHIGPEDAAFTFNKEANRNDVLLVDYAESRVSVDGWKHQLYETSKKALDFPIFTLLEVAPS